jgi:hypothetical protein
MDRALEQGARRRHSRSYGDDEQRSASARDALKRYRFGCYRPLAQSFRMYTRAGHQKTPA